MLIKCYLLYEKKLCENNLAVKNILKVFFYLYTVVSESIIVPKIVQMSNSSKINTKYSCTEVLQNNMSLKLSNVSIHSINMQ